MSEAFKQAMRCHHPEATPAEESIAWRLWQSAWSEARRDLARVKPLLVTRDIEDTREGIRREFSRGLIGLAARLVRLTPIFDDDGGPDLIPREPVVEIALELKGIATRRSGPPVRVAPT